MLLNKNIGKDGARTTNNANEIAHYEFGAALASDCMLDAMDLIDEGVTEMELGDRLVRYGQHTSVVTIAASGPRFVRGNMYPTENRIKVGDPIALTVGYRGGLSSRAGYAVVEQVLPKTEYHWNLCPGHLTAEEEWMSSPVYEGSEEILPMCSTVAYLRPYLLDKDKALTWGLH